MDKKSGPKKGFREKKKLNKAQQIAELEKSVQGLQMAVRIMQMGFQQFGGSLQRLDTDINNSMGVLNDLQYRTLAMLELGDFDRDKLDKIASDLKLKDFNDASKKEDIEKKYEDTDVIAEDSVVTITSECTTNNKKSIFRSKFKLDESGNPAASKEFPGKKVGDKFKFTIGKDEHIIEILDIKKAPKKEEEIKLDVKEDKKECSDCDSCDKECKKEG